MQTAAGGNHAKWLCTRCPFILFQTEKGLVICRECRAAPTWFLVADNHRQHDAVAFAIDFCHEFCQLPTSSLSTAMKFSSINNATTPSKRQTVILVDFKTYDEVQRVVLPIMRLKRLQTTSDDGHETPESMEAARPGIKTTSDDGHETPESVGATARPGIKAEMLDADDRAWDHPRSSTLQNFKAIMRATFTPRDG